MTTFILYLGIAAIIFGVMYSIYVLWQQKNTFGYIGIYFVSFVACSGFISVFINTLFSEMKPIFQLFS